MPNDSCRIERVCCDLVGASWVRSGDRTLLCVASAACRRKRRGWSLFEEKLLPRCNARVCHLRVSFVSTTSHVDGSPLGRGVDVAPDPASRHRAFIYRESDEWRRVLNSAQAQRSQCASLVIRARKRRVGSVLQRVHSSKRTWSVRHVPLATHHAAPGPFGFAAGVPTCRHLSVGPDPAPSGQPAGEARSK